MWNEAHWQHFLTSNCVNYPNENVAGDAKFLAEQQLEPRQFKSFIERCDKAFPSFFLQKVSTGNFLRIIEGLENFVKGETSTNKHLLKRQIDTSPASSSQLQYSKVANALDLSPPSKKISRPFDISLVAPRYSTWFQQVKKYMFFFVRGNDQENRRCVAAFAPTFAVTYAHSGNLELNAPKWRDGKIVEEGTKFAVHSFHIDEKERSRKTIDVEVIATNPILDFVILRALHGATFFEGAKESTILKSPSIGDKFLCLGVSSSLEIHPVEGIIMALTLKSKSLSKRGFGIMDCMVWRGDSGGGLFSDDGKLLGIVSGAVENTRSVFVSADTIEVGLNESTNPSGFHLKHPQANE